MKTLAPPPAGRRHPGTNLEYAKGYNQRVMLQAIRLHGPISRADLARLSGLSVQAVTGITNELIDRRLIAVTGRRTGVRGFPAMELEINPNGGFGLGVSINLDRLSMVLADLNGRPREDFVVSVAAPGPDETLALIQRGYDEFIGRNRLYRERLLGAGLGFPVRFQSPAGDYVMASGFEDWAGFDIAAAAAEAFGIDVHFENDSTAAATAEALFGHGRTLRDFLYINIGAGLGGGVILGGRPYRGRIGNAGGLGATPLGPVRRLLGLPDDCLCLQQVLSFGAAARLTRDWSGTALDVPGLPDTAWAENPHLSRWVDTAARALLPTLTSLQMTMDLDAVVFGGRLQKVGIAALIASLQTHFADYRTQRATLPPLLPARLDGASEALGAAILPLYDAIAPDPARLLKPDMGGGRPDHP